MGDSCSHAEFMHLLPLEKRETAERQGSPFWSADAQHSSASLMDSQEIPEPLCTRPWWEVGGERGVRCAV